MADELLNIEDSSLQNIANAIRTKGGTNQPLEFPAGFVSALQAIETDATVTPKIQPQQVTLTKDSTNFPIAAGFHDGTGTVGISLQSKTVTPNDNQQDVVPDAGKLLSEVIVNAVSAGYKMATGTITVSEVESFSITGLNFTPSIVCLVLQTVGSGSRSPYWAISHYDDSANPPSEAGRLPYKASSYSNNGSLVSPSVQSAAYSNNSVTFYKAAGQYSTYRYNGTYVYAIWGS